MLGRMHKKKKVSLHSDLDLETSVSETTGTVVTCTCGIKAVDLLKNSACAQDLKGGHQSVVK